MHQMEDLVRAQTGSDVFPLQTVDAPFLLPLLFPETELYVQLAICQTAFYVLELLADD